MTSFTHFWLHLRSVVRSRLRFERGDLVETMLSVIILTAVTVSFAAIYTSYVSTTTKSEANTKKNNLVTQYAAKTLSGTVVESYYGTSAPCAVGTTTKDCYPNETWTVGKGTPNTAFADYNYRAQTVSAGARVAQWGKLYDSTSGAKQGLVDVYTATPRSVTAKTPAVCDWTQTPENLYKNCIISHDTRSSNYQGATGDSPSLTSTQLVLRDGGNFYKDSSDTGTTFADLAANPLAATLGGAKAFPFILNGTAGTTSMSQSTFARKANSNTALPALKNAAKGVTSQAYFLLEITNTAVNAAPTKQIKLTFIYDNSSAYSACVITPSTGVSTSASACSAVTVGNKTFIRGNLSIPLNVDRVDVKLDTDTTDADTAAGPTLDLSALYLYYTQPSSGK